MPTIGYLPNGKVAFRSQNLRGLQTYARKHGITCAQLAEGNGRHAAGVYDMTFGNGATCRGTFADPAIMLGFFMGGRRVAGVILCERVVWNRGTALGNVTVPAHSAQIVQVGHSYGPWIVTRVYRDAQHVPMVRLERCDTEAGANARAGYLARVCRAAPEG